MPKRTRTTVILAAAVACATGLGVSPAIAGPAAGAPPPVAASSAPRQVTLVTGDVVTVSTQAGGRQTASVLRKNPDGPGGQFQMFTLAGDLYVVPQSAVPYLGSTMDLGLFDVSRPATANYIYRPGIDPQSVPKGAAFGAALSAQAQLDHASATHTTGLFASLARVSAGSPATVQPNFVMHTLTVNGIDQTGAADTGDDFLVYNVDDLRKYSGQAVWNNGLAKISVPAGRYAAVSFYYDFAAGIVREVTLPQFTVNGDSSITLDARAATSPVSVTTSQAATPAINEVGYGRTDKVGQTATFTFLGGGTTSFIAQPYTKKITAGQLHYYVYTRAIGDSVSYDLEFPSDGAIPVNQHYVVRDNDLAAIASSYPASHPGTSALDTRFGALPWQLFLFASDLSLSTPTQRTEYYSASPDINWQGVYYSVFNPDPFELLGAYQSAWRTYSPGTSYSTTWGGALGHPRLLEAPIYVGETVCPACLGDGNQLNLLAYPFGDNSPEHFGFPDSTDQSTYGVYADDVPVKTGNFLSTSAIMPAGTQTYRIDYDTNRSSADFQLATDVQSRWTVPASVQTGTLPAGWVCSTAATQPSSCGVVPLITSGYDLPVNLLGQLPAGATTGTLSLSHLAGSPSIAFKSVKIKVSFNDGQTWKAVTATDQGAGQYALPFTVPAGATFGALQVTARDAVGGTFTQTIQHAFAIGG